MEGATSERRKASDRRARAERRAAADRRRHERREGAERRALADRRSAADRRGDGNRAAAAVKQQPVVAPARKMSDRDKLEELVRTLTETLPNVTNFLASATQHARACQKGDLLMQALRARATFGTLGEAVRDGEAHVKNTQSRRA
jgi:hypothetical protein